MLLRSRCRIPVLAPLLIPPPSPQLDSRNMAQFLAVDACFCLEHLLGEGSKNGKQARTSNTTLKRCGESGQPCLVHDFRRIALSFSPFSLMLDAGLLCIAFIMFIYVPIILDLSQDLHHEGMLDFVKGFLCI
ncbi:hypothetical protein H671_6g15459 [Cricetulus griseus]|uniref:Uncharacterized protein n=1 Tax=Cricetulus griseus TaxID=10029 RepID=A0A061I1S4_CRIGR|nr:hypothetical protein H671_6g15459 [Cricetulus griseus]